MPHNGDKVVHFTAYCVLGASCAWAARTRTVLQALRWMVVVSMLGGIDEWHQQFIPSRSMDVRDWMADTAGAVTGLSLVTALARRREPVA
jgi:VanZ family protein